MFERKAAAALRVVAIASAILCVGCIERAPTPQGRRASFNRGSVSEVLLRSMPAPAQKVGAVFGDAVELVGADWTPARPSPGQRVDVTFYYRVLAEVDEDYKVFVHAENHEKSSDRINGDHWVAGGVYPTGVWRRGEVIRDRWSFTVPSYFKGEAIDLWTGFYQPGKDDRFPITNREQVRTDGSNRVMAGSIPVGG